VRFLTLAVPHASRAGDRRLRVKLPGDATCAAFAGVSSLGPVLLVGLSVGTTVVYSPDELR
jgi:hypothetical protein